MEAHLLPLTAFLTSGPTKVDPLRGMPARTTAYGFSGGPSQQPVPAGTAARQAIFWPPASRARRESVTGREKGRAHPAIEATLAAFELVAAPNPLRFEERLREAVVDGQPFTVLVLAVDGVAEIEARYGQRTAGRLLQAIGTRLQTAVDDSDVVVRVGEEEFGVLLPETDATNAGLAAHRAGEALTQVFIVNGHRMRVSVRVGVAAYPQHGSNGAALLRQAAAEVGVVL